MELQTIQQILKERGYGEAANLLTKLKNKDEMHVYMLQIFELCNIANNSNLTDASKILHDQIYALTVFKPEFAYKLQLDFLTILKDFVTTTDHTTAIYLSDSDREQVITLYQQAMHGDSEAQLELGDFYKQIGHNDWAFTWYEFAALAGNADALYWLGNLYYDGDVVAQDLEKTYTCYQEAAQKGHPDAINNYADMYLRGEYVEKDEKRALELFTVAAKHGVPEAMYTLGYMYENGVGTATDLEKSKEWFIQSALHGDVFAANRLGHEAIENGNGEEAIDWYRMAADREDSYGEFNLGLCYEEGIGTPVNIKKAKYWYQKAALKGDKQARERLKQL
ncbi:tetratricopeptide repeat protein [Ornithinibacillus contaminans]|uniref:tetratricopeptide repeat protein n=1 Tax=Ornithinibacillus contaminans TaxID=694055 RepID=UPI00064DED28|nr:tetratricopeptide repeat protein [Ornithinibacillus contaminans]